MAEEILNLGICEGSVLDLAYRLRENEHPQFAGMELEIAALRLATAEQVNPEWKT